ncbi:MAG TPA: hypothetical protein VFS63_12430 [Pseudolabrys sp.]|nr:hypothetical protein [Pseudolabrys sp.]
MNKRIDKARVIEGTLSPSCVLERIEWLVKADGQHAEIGFFRHHALRDQDAVGADANARRSLLRGGDYIGVEAAA